MTSSIYPKPAPVPKPRDEKLEDMKWKGLLHDNMEPVFHVVFFSYSESHRVRRRFIF